MESILTVDIGSSSMRAILHDDHGAIVHKCQKSTIPDYRAHGKIVELDAVKFVDALLCLLKESYGYCESNEIKVLAISVTSQRSSVVPVNSQGTPLAPFITWHDKRTVPLCKALNRYENKVYGITGLRISPVLSAVKMTWIRKEQPEIYKKNSKDARSSGYSHSYPVW